MRGSALCSVLCALGATMAFAQAPDSGQGLTVGVNFHTAFATGPLADDVNHHPGFGMGITLPISLGRGHILRPNVEMTGTRVTEYNPAGWFFNQDPKDVFRTYKLGLDYLGYPGGNSNHGGYLFLGAGVQWSMLDLDAPTQDGQETYATYHRRGGAWLGAGLGFQFNAASALELRVSTFQYRAPEGLPLDVITPAPTEDRTATKIHLVWALRVPVH
jgi:hypothetical protein